MCCLSHCNGCWSLQWARCSKAPNLAFAQWALAAASKLFLLFSRTHAPSASSFSQSTFYAADLWEKGTGAIEARYTQSPSAIPDRGLKVISLKMLYIILNEIAVGIRHTRRYRRNKLCSKCTQLRCNHSKIRSTPRNIIQTEPYRRNRLRPSTEAVAGPGIATLAVWFHLRHCQTMTVQLNAES